jgi:hypothetical protein
VSKDQVQNDRTDDTQENHQPKRRVEREVFPANHNISRQTSNAQSPEQKQERAYDEDQEPYADQSLAERIHCAPPNFSR